MKLSANERLVLRLLIEDFNAHGKRFGILQTARPSGISPQSFAGTVSALKKKGLIKDLIVEPRSYFTVPNADSLESILLNGES